MSTEVKKQDTNKEPRENKEPRPPRNIETNVYRLSLKTLFKQSIFISKIIMKKHGSLQLESMGAAISEASRAAQTLVKHGYATIKSIKTQQFTSEERDKGRLTVKLIIVLEKTQDFDKLTESLVIRQ